MLSLHHLRRLAASGHELRLGWRDRVRFLWSYYGTRLPGAEARRLQVQQILVRNQTPNLRLAIRTNAIDADFVDEIFARNAYRLTIPGVRTILDLGANIGLASVFLQLAYPDAALACVEPVPANIRMIKLNFELNNLAVRLFEAAVGPEDGEAQFQILPSDPGAGSALYAGVIPDSRPEIVTVPMISVPSIMRTLGWDRIDLLKLDIEGGERQLLSHRPEWLAKVGAIIGEGHRGFGDDYSFEVMAGQLSPFGLRVRLLEDRGGAFVFAADSDSARITELPRHLETGLGPIRRSHAFPG
jgi:FkbM family methyltransferase